MVGTGSGILVISLLVSFISPSHFVAVMRYLGVYRGGVLHCHGRSRLWGSPSSASRTGRSGAAGTGGQYACLGQYAFGVSTPAGSVRTPAGGQPRRGPWSHAAGAATCRPSRSTGGQPAYLGDLLRNGYMLLHVALLRFGLG